MPRSISVRHSGIHGRGLFALRTIAADQLIIRYRGQLLTHEEADEYYGDDGESGHTFLFTLNDNYVLDGNQGGNSARWINHSCQPNCESVCVEASDGNPRHDRIEIYSLRDIEAGEELTYDYGIVLDTRHTKRLKRVWACHCGAPNCTGTLLKPKRRRKG